MINSRSHIQWRCRSLSIIFCKGGVLVYVLCHYAVQLTHALFSEGPLSSHREIFLKNIRRYQKRIRFVTMKGLFRYILFVKK